MLPFPYPNQLGFLSLYAAHSAVLLCDQELFYLKFSLAAATDEDGEVGCLNTSEHVLGKSTVQSLQCSLIQGWLAVVLDFKVRISHSHSVISKKVAGYSTAKEGDRFILY
ncbi:unnamed protein product [Prunus armeniaca]|uniref:Uncharacterized protein n=1 Tax=Prunus armeniaca TaxID=36596 RepID=A0A6J5X451_PRUAR|nr:unnamed protein product [Prunus armeniaca]